MQNVSDKSIVSSRRDIINFINARVAKPSDDFQLGQFLVNTFKNKQTEKNPHHSDTDERIIDLMNVRQRRENGVVIVYELGYQILGTFTLFYQTSPLNNAWLPNSTLLRCVAIHSDFNGLSLSSHLLEDADRVSYHMGANQCCLHVYKNAPSVARLYEKHGYQRDPQGDHMSCGAEVLGYIKTVTSEFQGLSRILLQ